MGIKRIISIAARIVGVLLLVVIGLPIGCIAYQNFVPHLLFNETTRYLYQYRTMVGRNADISLMPGLFKGGETKGQVEAQLLSAGLDAWNTSYMTMPPGAESVQRFHLNAGARGIACGSELFVVIGYDQNDLLTSATVEQGGACL